MRRNLFCLAACLLLFTGCGADTDVPPLDTITTENVMSITAAMTGNYNRDDLIGAWGNPDGMLSGMYGEMWDLAEEDHRLVVYYDTDSAFSSALISYKETYTGTVTELFTEGCGLDTAEAAAVDIGNGETMYFTITAVTEYIGADAMSVGDTVTIVCDSTTHSDYHGIVTAEILG